MKPMIVLLKKVFLIFGSILTSDWLALGQHVVQTGELK